MAKADRFALDQEGQARVVRADPRGLVFAQEPRFRVTIGRGVEPTADCRDVSVGRLEPLARPPERRRLFLGDLGVDPPMRLVQARHRVRAIASRYTAIVRSICRRTSNSRSATSRARRAMARRAREVAEREFDVRLQIDRTMAVYLDAIARTR